MSGLAPQNLRLTDEPHTLAFPGSDVVVEFANENPADSPEVSENGDIISIRHGDGSVTVDATGKSLGNVNREKSGGHFANLVSQIDDMELGVIASDLLRGIEDDNASRTEWIEARATGIQLMGLKIEVPAVSGASEGAPVEGMSKVRHPLLLEAVLRFQANARSELLPTDGPVKIRNDDNNAQLEEDQVANALEKDLNHYLTSTATEYYPDTDRMLLMLGFGGTAFKKVYFCPLRNRPVSETVDASDLIVNSAATDLANAKRVTHRVLMRSSTVKRLQILEVYREIDLSTPNAPKMDSLDREKAAQQGVAPEASNPEDRDREIYECYCELDIKGFEHKISGRATGLEIPYRVTIDVTSQQVLSIVRNYNPPEPVDKPALMGGGALSGGMGHNGGPRFDQLPEARRVFVKYTFVPGFGFYDIGLLHILGNTTNALTATWRLMLDNGMFANFPGFLIAKSGSRQNTNIFRVPPGGGAQVDTGGMKMSEAILPLPYGTSHMPALQSLSDEIATTGMRIGGTSEQQVGEGRSDAPVGTTLALIDQAAKVLNSVHKRMHAAQAEEFNLLKDCFRENPDSFWQRKHKSAYPWDQRTFLSALENCDLVPQADPNTASHTQRVMKVMGLKQLQAASPKLYDGVAVDTAALQALGWSNAQQFFSSSEQQQQPDPEVLKGMADIEDAKARTANDAKRADAAMISAQASARADTGGGTQEDTPVDIQTANARDRELELQAEELRIHDENSDLDREADMRLAAIDLAKEHLRVRGEESVARVEASAEVKAARLKKPKASGDGK